MSDGSSPAPATAAADPTSPRQLTKVARRERLAFHAGRLFLVSLTVMTVLAGISVVVSRTGTGSCHREGNDEICVKRTWWRYTLQVRSELWTKNGTADGPRRDWHPDGTPWMTGQYQAGNRVGRWVEHWPNGNVRFEGNFVADKLQGVETWFYENGSPEFRVHRDDGLRTGLEEWWWPEGALRRVGHYVAGEKHGSFRNFGPDGGAAFERSYNHGI